MTNKKQHTDQPRQLTGHQKLERRRLLNADFDFTGGVLELSNFVDSDAGMPNEVSFEQTGVDSYQINLADGVFANGTNSATVSGFGTDTLFLDNSLGAISSILSQSTTADVFNIEFGDFSFDGDITIEQDGGAAFGTVSQQAGTSLQSTGTLEITGADIIALDNTIGNDLGNLDIQNANTISLAEVTDVDASTIEASGEVTVVSGGNVTLNGATIGGELDIATTSGDVNVDATGDLLLSDISTDAGTVDVSTTGDIEIGSVSASGDVDVTSTGGSINDLQDDLVDDISSGGTIRLNAIDEVGSGTATTVVDAAGKLEVADGSILEIDSATEDVAIRGTGSLVIQDIQATGGTANVVAADDIQVIEIAGATGVFVGAGEDGTGAITLAGTVTTTAANGRVLLQSAGAVVQDSGVITTNGLLLEGSDFTLDSNNVVDILAADVLGNLTFVNDVALVIGGLTYTSVCTTSTVTGVTAGSLDINADDEIAQTESITVMGDSVIEAANEICLTDTANDFVGAVIASGTTVEIVDANDLTTGDITAVDDIFLGAGATAAGGLTLDGNVSTTSGAGQVLLRSSDGVTQSAGVITTSELLLGGNLPGEGSGAFDLTASNVVDSLAANLQGSLNFNNAIDLEISDLNYVSDCGSAESISGVTVGADLLLNVTGMVSQSAAVIVPGNATITATDEVCLTDVGNDFSGDVDVSGTTIEIVDANDLTIGDVTAIDDIYLAAGASGVGAGLLTIDGNLTTSAAGGQILLQSSGGVVQTAGIITSNDLLLGGDSAIEGSGTFSLAGSNAINNLATNLQDNLTLNNVVDLEFSDLTYASACGTIETITGATVGGDLALLVTGNLSQSAAVNVSGTSNLTATGEICLIDPVNDFVGIVSADGLVVEIVDSNNLTTGTIVASENIFLAAGASGTGGLTLAGNVSASDLASQVLLQSADGVTQTAGIINGNDLLLGGNAASEGGGAFILSGANNVNNLAADIDGELFFNNSVAVNIESLTYLSSCGTTEAITGIDTALKAMISADGIAIDQAISSSLVFLESTNGIMQAAAGVIATTDLMLSGAGILDLSNAANNTDNLAANVDGTLNYTDADGFTVARLDCDGIEICGIATTGDLNIVTNNGTIFQNLDAAVIVGGNASFDTGSGDLCLTGGDCTGDGVNDNLFTGTLTIVTTGDVVIAENDDISIDSVAGGGSFRFIGNNIQINTAIVGNQLLLEASDGVDYNGNTIDVQDLILVGNGRFDFGNTGEIAISIDNLAADIDGALNINSDSAINIADLTFVSDCGDVSVCGVNIDADAGSGEAGDFDLIIANADLTQTASIAVEGTATMDVGTGDICLTGGDCTGDLLNDNDFNIVIASGSTIEIVDINDLTAGDITAVNDIFLRAGDTALFNGTLTLNGSLTTTNFAGQVLLQSDTEIAQGAGSVIATNELLVGASLDAEFRASVVDLDGANQVNNLAVGLDNSFRMLNAIDLKVSSISYTSDCGTTESQVGISVAGGDAALTVLGNLTVEQAAAVSGGNLLFDVRGDLSQLASGNLTASGLALIVDGNTVLTNASNDVDALAATTDGAIQYTDANDLKVGSVLTVNPAVMVDGITTSNDDVNLTAAGNLTLEEAVNVGEGDLFLDVDGDLSQLASGTIDAAGLGLMVNGETVLNETNDIDVLGAGNDGATQFNDINDLKIGTVTAEAVSADRAMTAMNGTVAAAAVSITGVTTSDDDVKLTAAGNVTFEEAANLGAGDLFLDADGDVTQLAAGTIDAAGLGLMVAGETVLTAANDIDVLAVNNDSAIQVNDINDLKVGSVTAEAVSADRAMAAMNGTVDAAAMFVTGIMTSNDDVKLMAAGNMTLEEAINLGEGDLFLDVDGDLSQLAAGTIDAAGLGLMVVGETALNEANDIDVLATNNSGATQVNDISDLKVGSVTAEAFSADRAMAAMNGAIESVAMSITGVTSVNDDVKLGAEGNLTFEAAVSLRAGDLFVDVNGDVTQLAVGTIDAAGLGLMVDGETVLNEANDIDVLAAFNNGATQVTTISDLAVGTVIAEAVSADRAMLAMNGTVDLAAMSITGVTTFDDDVKLTVAGNLMLEGAIDIGDSVLFLDVDGNVLQSDAGTINATGLGLIVTNETVLNAANDIDVLAFRNEGASQVNAVNSLVVGTVTVEAVSADRAMFAMNGTVDSAEMLITGVTTSDDDVKLTVGGALDIQELVTLGAGDLLLDVDGAVGQQDDGNIQASGLGLMVTGDTILNNLANDVDRIAAGNGGDQGAIQFIDADDLTVGVVTVEAVAADPTTVEMLLTGITIDSEPGTTLVDINYTDQIDLLDDTIQTLQLGGEPIYNPSFEQYLTGLGETNDGTANAVGVALLSNGELQVNQEVVSASDIFLATTDGDISVNQTVVAADAADKILVVAADELNLNAPLIRGALDGSVFNVSNLNPSLATPALLLNPSDTDQSLALINGDTFTQMFETTFGQVGEQNFTTTVFFGVALDSYAPLSILAPDFTVLDFVVPATLADLNDLLLNMGVENFESRSIYLDLAGGQPSVINESQPINGPNDLLPPSAVAPFPATATFTLDFLVTNPEFRSVAFVFNDAGINIFDNASGGGAGLRDLNVAVEDFQAFANIGTPPVTFVEQEEVQTVNRVEITSSVEPNFFQTVVVTDEPLFTQTVQEKFFVVVYFESQAEADDFESIFEGLATSETGEIDYDRLRELLTRFDSLEFTTDDENESLDVNKIRQIFEKAELDLDGDDEQWQEAFQAWLKRRQFGDESLEVPRGVYKIIEVENGRAIIQGDDVDRRFVPESSDRQQTEDYPFEVPSGEADDAELNSGLLDLKSANDVQNESAAKEPISGRMTRWVAMLAGQNPAANHEVGLAAIPVEPGESVALPNVGGALVASTSAVGLLGLVVQRNAVNNRTAADEIEDLAKVKLQQPERNVFSKAARFYRRNQQVLQDRNQDQ